MTELTLHCAETKHVYPPANVCIYCGADDEAPPLSTEHILPAGLGGNLELPRASCRPCAVITGSLEQKLLRGPLWPVRVRTGIHSGRRPGQQPTDFDVEYWRDNERMMASTPINDMSVNLMLPTLPAPGMLNGGDYDPVLERMQTNVHSFDDGGFDEAGQIQERYRRQDMTGFTVGKVIDALLWRRLIAKIAHGYALAEAGPIFRPLLPDLILGNRVEDAGQLVGSARSYTGDDATLRHGIGLFEQEVAGQSVLCVGIALFAPKVRTLFIAAVGERTD